MVAAVPQPMPRPLEVVPAHRCGARSAWAKDALPRLLAEALRRLSRRSAAYSWPGKRTVTRPL